MDLIENILETNIIPTVEKPPSQNTSNSSPIFARHETFHPRYGWLKKGFDVVLKDPEIFNKESAPADFGVGKNMVRAVRYWCSAFKILKEIRKSGQKGFSYIPSKLGFNLLKNDGWDPFLEDPASLWLLHWNLIKPPSLATAWYFTFNHFHQGIFTAEDLLRALKDLKSKFFPTNNIIDASLNKDIHCLLRMYVTPHDLKSLKEDSLDCPFSDLGILKHNGDSKHFSFNIGNKLGLPAEIIVVACLEYISSLERGAKTISIARLLYEPGSPGLVFKLSESSLFNAIESVSSKNKDLFLSETAGLIQFSFAKDPILLAESILNNYYKKRK